MAVSSHRIFTPTVQNATTPNVIAVPVGKLALYSALAGVNPENTLPITLDVGTDNAPLRGSSAYVGIRQPRPPTAAYDAFVDEFVHAVKDRFGPRVLLQWEDFGNEHAFKLSQRYKSTLPSYNDDIEGTAAVTLAGALSVSHVGSQRTRESVLLLSLYYKDIQYNGHLCSCLYCRSHVSNTNHGASLRAGNVSVFRRRRGRGNLERENECMAACMRLARPSRQGLESPI